MTRYALRLEDLTQDDVHLVGGKAAALADLMRCGLTVPGGFVIPFDAYHHFLEHAKLRDRVFFEVNRKPFDDMRWEEVWDAALRIRNMFISADMPAEVQDAIVAALHDGFDRQGLVLRSSAMGEDSAETSFAGLHDSFVNVRGASDVLRHVQLVWASLWSDRALLYRRELGLDVRRSAMAVIVQRLVDSSASGVAFSRHPLVDDQALIEGVYGLNQGLVDGTIEPDRWSLDAKTGEVLKHEAACRRRLMVRASTGTKLIPMDAKRAERPPLNADQVSRVFQMTMSAASFFGSPQDVEWTFERDALYALQARPITRTSQSQDDDQRPWYLSLTRTFDNLKSLRRKIEEDILPGMDAQAQKLASRNLSRIDDQHLAREIKEREAILEEWRGTYKRDCIPFAHGMRLFGRIYNDVLNPADPYEFVDLLHSSSMIALERNRKLLALAAQVRADAQLADNLAADRWDHIDPAFTASLDAFLDAFGVMPEWTAASRADVSGHQHLAHLLTQMAQLPPGVEPVQASDYQHLERKFMEAFDASEQKEAETLLDLARASYRLRDDDNAYLDRIKREWQRAVHEGQRRLVAKWKQLESDLDPAEIVKALHDPEYKPRPKKRKDDTPDSVAQEPIRARQLTGQPAGPGLASGPARVIEHANDVFALKKGEILICDSIKPSMTFIVPLASGIVERRGGMLIHGAIIAREYGLPCVTGVPRATQLIHTGDWTTVDGHLGIVIVS